MKRISILILISLAMMWEPVLAETLTDTDDPRPVTYEVRLIIKYNAVTAQQASDITKAALAAHGQEACQVEVKINKNDGNNIGILADTGLGDALLTLTETDAPSSFPITTK